MEPTRRAFLQKSAVAGGLVWAAPAITSVVHAAAVGSPPACSCTGEAYALYGHLNDPATLGPYPTAPNGPCQPINLTTPGGVVFLGTACATLTGCAATATLTNFSLVGVGFTLAASVIGGSQTLVNCCQPSVQAQVVSLLINGNPVSIGVPNFVITIGDITITLNEQIQSCDSTTGIETSEANVIHISSPTLFKGTNIVLGHTKLVSSGPQKCC